MAEWDLVASGPHRPQGVSCFSDFDSEQFTLLNGSMINLNKSINWIEKAILKCLISVLLVWIQKNKHLGHIRWGHTLARVQVDTLESLQGSVHCQPKAWLHGRNRQELLSWVKNLHVAAKNCISYLSHQILPDSIDECQKRSSSHLSSDRCYQTHPKQCSKAVVWLASDPHLDPSPPE